MSNGNDEPQDLRRGWIDVARRLQATACKGGYGYAILTIRIVTDMEGNPRFWTEPQRMRLDGRADDANAILAILSGGQ